MGDLLAQGGDLRIQEVDVRQLLVEQEALRRAHLPVQRLGQLRPLGAQLARASSAMAAASVCPATGCQHGSAGQAHTSEATLASLMLTPSSSFWMH